MLIAGIMILSISIFVLTSAVFILYCAHSSFKKAQNECFNIYNDSIKASLELNNASYELKHSIDMAAEKMHSVSSEFYQRFAKETEKGLEK